MYGAEVEAAMRSCSSGEVKSSVKPAFCRDCLASAAKEGLQGGAQVRTVMAQARGAIAFV